MISSSVAGALIAQAGETTVGGLFRARARLSPAVVAVDDGARSLSYAALNERVNRAAHGLVALGVRHGDRVALLSENRVEYLELQLAAAKLGVIVACQNWRLAAPELQHCIGLVEPKAVFVSPCHAGLLAKVETGAVPVIQFGKDYEARLAAADAREPAIAARPEDGLLILYTSGTTGLPKGAVLSHRAEIARFLVLCAEFGVVPGDSYAAWAPLYHMAATEPSLAALVTGGTVLIVDGFDPGRLAQIAGEQRFGWFLVMPGMVQPLIDELKRRNTRPRGVRVCGAMADLVPAHQIAEITRLLDAPYANTFGATETGAPPASAGRIPVGEVPTNLAKTQNAFCEIRLVDEAGNDVTDGLPGELAFRGPTLFSGYWQAEATNLKDFRGGWFHMGDMFIRNPDGTLNFVDRAKYMIKSGGENIYPAEIERVLLSEARVADAVVVRRQDAKWGEVPVAFVARKDDGLDAAALHRLCREQLAGYKQPKDIRFVPFEALPRSTTGKIQRHEIEAWLKREAAAQ